MQLVTRLVVGETVTSPEHIEASDVAWLNDQFSGQRSQGQGQGQGHRKDPQIYSAYLY